MPHGHGAKNGLGRRLGRWLFYAVHVSLRGLALLLLLGVLLAVTSYLGLRAAFNEERIRSVFVAQIQDILHLPVQIDKVLLAPGDYEGPLVSRVAHMHFGGPTTAERNVLGEAVAATPRPGGMTLAAGMTLAWTAVHGFVGLVCNGLILLDEAPIAAAERALEQQRSAFSG